MTDHDMLAIEARKVKLTQVSNKDGNWYDVTFQIHPDDAINTELAQWPLRQRVSLVVARIREDGAGDKEQPPEATTEKDTADWSDAKRMIVKQSGILRKKDAFQSWLSVEYAALWVKAATPNMDSYQIASEVVHTICDVESCSNLDPDGPSGAAFRSLMDRYHDYQYGQSLDQMESMKR